MLRVRAEMDVNTSAVVGATKQRWTHYKYLGANKIPIIQSEMQRDFYTDFPRTDLQQKLFIDDWNKNGFMFLM